MKEKVRTTSFWLGVAGVAVVVVNSISSVLGISIASDVVEAVVISISSILVILGVVHNKNINENTKYSKEELIGELYKDDNEVDDL